MYGVKIAGIGIALPDWVVDNNEIAELLKAQRAKIPSDVILTKKQEEEFITSDEWIRPRTGVITRRFAKPNETTSDFAAIAGHAAWTDAYGDGLGIPDFLLTATVSPDNFTTPPLPAPVQRKMGIPTRIGKQQKLIGLISGEITLACNSFVSALTFGVALIQSGMCQRGLVIGADCMTRVNSWNRRSPFIILGDGAGAIVLEATEPKKTWFADNSIFMGVDGGKDGEFEKLIINPAGGAAMPIQPEHLNPLVDLHMMFMKGDEVLKIMIRLFADEVIPAALAKARKTLQQIYVLILHQANLRIIKGGLERLAAKNPDIAFLVISQDMPQGYIIQAKNAKPKHTITVYNSIDHVGNTTSASLLIGLWEAREMGLVQPGMLVDLDAFGGGISWGNVLIHWGGIDQAPLTK